MRARTTSGTTALGAVLTAATLLIAGCASTGAASTRPDPTATISVPPQTSPPTTPATASADTALTAQLDAAKPFTGYAADTFGAASVMRAYRMAATYSNDKSFDFPIIHGPEAQLTPQNFDVLLAGDYLTDGYASRVRAQALASHDSDKAQTNLNGLVWIDPIRYGKYANSGSIAWADDNAPAQASGLLHERVTVSVRQPAVQARS